ncbi:DUF2786 domain-containing protein [Salibacterium aidingense]|uniref:DUF2786 domain-containing protein n=1 Tax=Salibacterium aidingense TaxID=384933 RepID=UPI000405E6B9|nr:DUF2786 domain-containing protein [Salibacterium aidingense]
MGSQVNTKNDYIIKKITRLLALAEDNSNEHEAQSAFLMAQKLMLKNNIAMDEIQVSDGKRNIEEGQVTTHKRLHWWERKLGIIMANNFRVKNFINWKKNSSRGNRKSAVCFMGYDKDVQLAKEMYLLAYEAITLLSKNFIDGYYKENDIERTQYNTLSIKNSYINGFLSGLEEKFEEQIEQIKAEENALMVLVPKEVEDKFEEEITGKSKSFKIPSISEIQAYQTGYEDGNKIDYTRSTIDEYAEF